MILTLIFTAIISIIGSVLFFLPVVDVLPFGIDTAMTFFVGVINSLLEIFPFMEVVWNLILLSLVIEVLLFTWTWVRWFIERIK